MNNIEIASHNGNIWEPSQTTMWPDKRYKLRFFAYAPYSTATGNFTLPKSSVKGSPEVHYTVPDDVDKHVDIVVASTAPIACGKVSTPVKLSFSHALTAVRIVASGEMLPGYITAIRFKGIQNSGTYSYEDNSWTTDGERAEDGSVDKAYLHDYTIDAGSRQVTGGDNGSGQHLTLDDETLFMIPQTLPKTASLEIDFRFTDKSAGGNEKEITLSCPIAGDVWRQGKIVEYLVSTSNLSLTPHLMVSKSKSFNYDGTPASDRSYSVISYLERKYKNVDYGNVDISWHIEFKDEEGNWTRTPPDGCTMSAYSGKGTNWISAYIDPVESIVHNAHNLALRQTTPVEGIYDLSTLGGTAEMNTANCYIVSAPGTYSLPLVYGNAIKNGKTNPGAYKSTSTANYMLTTFTDYLDRTISTPYIYNAYTPADATLVWEDSPGLVKDVSLTDDLHNLMFHVSEHNIRQGNAVVAVRDANGKIMWSWHIWVTDYRPGDSDVTITNRSGDTYTLMKQYVGWCDEETEEFPERVVEFRVVQDSIGLTPLGQPDEEGMFGSTPVDGKLVSTTRIRQLSHKITTIGTPCYFQWGRKDPFPGGIRDFNNSSHDGKNEKPIFTTNNNYKYIYTDTRQTIGEAIQAPHHFTGHSDEGNLAKSWCSAVYLNNWSINNVSDSRSGKTIYDPSPVGYCVTPAKTFTGFTTGTGTTAVTKAASINGTLDDTAHGYRFQRVKGDNSNPLLLHFGGLRSGGGYVTTVGTRCDVWTAFQASGTSKSRSWAYCLSFQKNNVWTLKPQVHSYGNAVLPCRED